MPWKPLIHIITPDASERNVLRAQLLGADYNVAAFHDPVQAAAALAEEIPHLVIIDELQTRQGRSAFKRFMEKLQGASPLPLLFLVQDTDLSSPPAALREGIDDTLLRPVKSLELIARAGSLMRNRQLLGQIRIQELFLGRQGMPVWTPSEKEPSVVLVEDETSERDHIESLLAQIPCRLITFQNPLHALLHVRRHVPDLVILDMLFPDQDGLELYRFLKERDETKNTPLLMLTALPELDNRVMGVDSGPDDYLVKPLHPSEVKTRVRRLLLRRESSSRLEGNKRILQRNGLSDPRTGIAGSDYFRFLYPEMVAWSERAQLPFTVARIRLTAREGFRRLSSAVRSSLRSFDLVFLTDRQDLTLILPETPTDRAQIALGRAVRRAEGAGISPADLKIATVSIGEEGWGKDQMDEDLLARAGAGLAEGAAKEPGDRIVVVGNGDGGVDVAELLRSEGFSSVTSLPMEPGQKPRRIRAGLVVVQADWRRIPDLLERLLPALPDDGTPVLVRFSGVVSDSALEQLPDRADYVLPGSGSEYFLHRVRMALDTARHRNGTREMERFLRRLVRLLEECDTDVKGHSAEVSQGSVSLGKRLGLSADELEALRWGGLLHDIGKLFLPGRILTKEGLLSPEEFTVVKSHPRLGYDLCRAFSMLDPALPIIKHHHERLDGKGYPEGLRGDKIPMLVRIASVVDVYDTLTRRRPFRPAFSPSEAAAILLSEARKGLWDAGIVETFLKTMG